jgi:hypothetical protein
LSELYVIAFTSGLSGAESQLVHGIQIQLNGDVQEVIFHDNSGVHYQSNKGDFWRLFISAFGFSESCISISGIERVSIIGSGLDDWNIKTIVTLVRDLVNNYQILTHDFDVHHWISGDDADGRFDLNFAGKCKLMKLLPHP